LAASVWPRGAALETEIGGHIFGPLFAQAARSTLTDDAGEELAELGSGGLQQRKVSGAQSQSQWCAHHAGLSVGRQRGSLAAANNK